jgi:hypothetical protein
LKVIGINPWKGRPAAGADTFLMRWIRYPGAALAVAGSSARRSADLKAAFADNEEGKGKSVHGRYVGVSAEIVKPA